MNERIAAGIGVRRRRQRDAQRQQAVGLEADRHARQPREALQQQAGADEQHQRQRDLGDDERVARRRGATTSRRGRRSSARRPATAGPTSDEGIRPKTSAGRERHGEREREHAAVRRRSRIRAEAHAAPTRRDRRSRTRAARRATPPVSASSRLSPHIQRVRSQRLAPSASANRRLVRSRRRANEQQVRDVGAGDQQHEADGAHQHQQRRSRAADRALANRHEPQARVGIGVGVGRVGARVGVRDRVHFALRLLDAHAGREPRDRRQVAETAVDQRSAGSR